MPSGFLVPGAIGPVALAGGGLADPVPVAGAELLVNGDFSSAAGWNLGSGWSIGSGIATHTGGAGSIYRDAGIFGAWHSMTFDVMSTNGNLQGRIGDSYSVIDVTTGAKMFTARNIRVASILGLTAATTECTADNVSCKILTLSSLMSTHPYASADCDLSAAITRTAGTQAGFAVRVDDPANPANFIISYLDGAGNLKTDKCVAGTYTAIAGLTGAITYVAGQRPRIVCAGNDVSVYYNGTQVGSTTAVADAGIVSNKNHGLFSTYAANTFAGYVAA